jgi:hypothetical protein
LDRDVIEWHCLVYINELNQKEREEREREKKHPSKKRRRGE